MAETVITTVAMHAKTMNVTLSAVFFDIYATAREIICTVKETKKTITAISLIISTPCVSTLQN